MCVKGHQIPGGKSPLSPPASSVDFQFSIPFDNLQVSTSFW